MNSLVRYACRIRNAKQLVTVCRNGERFKRGKEMNQIEVIENGTMIIGDDGRIVAIGPESEISAVYTPENSTFTTDIDATGKCVLPGLVDAHTHPVWSGDRTHEFAMKLAGATYMDIHRMGGGIGFTVQHTRNATEEELERLFLARVSRMLRQGTTLIEAKSGYGLDTETEMKMLRVIHQARLKTPAEIVATFLAHSVPKDTTREAYTDKVVNEQIPTLKRLQDEGKVSVDLVDVFHEKGIFETEDARRILQAGKDAGFKLNFHGDELHAMGSAELGAELGALAVSHLELVSQEGIRRMAERDVCALLLPTTAYILRLEYPPARAMIEAGVPVAIASDYNPNAHCLSLPFVMNLACVQMRMTMNEALCAATINAAACLDRSSTHGSLEVGKHGDCIVLDAPLWEHLIYEMVDPPIEMVIRKGVVVYNNNK